MCARCRNRDPATAFRFFSAGSQKILGSEDKFGESLKKNRRYGAMLVGGGRGGSGPRVVVKSSAVAFP